MCYIGKASKIFLVLVTVLVVLGLIVGFTVYHHHQLPKSQKCENGRANCGNPIYPDPVPDMSTTANSSPPTPEAASADLTLPNHPAPKSTESTPTVNHPPSFPPPAITTPVDAKSPPPPFADGILSPAPMGPPGTGSQAQGPAYSP